MRVLNLFRLYLDEVGTDDLTHTIIDNHRFLSLTGVILEVRDARDHLSPWLNEVKTEVFDYDVDEPLILHRKDILQKKGPYYILRDPFVEQAFNAKISRIVSDVNYTMISVLIDKQWMLAQRHWETKHPYHYLMEILVEKYVQFLERNNSIGDIMPEARQGKPDRMLQEAFLEIRNSGTHYLKAERISSVLRGEKLKFRTKKQNIGGLQLCDLVAHPSHFYIRDRLGHDVNLGQYARHLIQIFENSKYDRSAAGQIVGYGVKWFT